MKGADARARAGRRQNKLTRGKRICEKSKNREQQANLHSPDLTTLDNKLGGVTQVNTTAHNSGHTGADPCGSSAAWIAGSNVGPGKFWTSIALQGIRGNARGK
jgi:hypothetical protein